MNCWILKFLWYLCTLHKKISWTSKLCLNSLYYNCISSLSPPLGPQPVPWTFLAPCCPRLLGDQITATSFKIHLRIRPSSQNELWLIHLYVACLVQGCWETWEVLSWNVESAKTIQCNWFNRCFGFLVRLTVVVVLRAFHFQHTCTNTKPQIIEIPSDGDSPSGLSKRFKKVSNIRLLSSH